MYQESTFCILLLFHFKLKVYRKFSFGVPLLHNLSAQGLRLWKDLFTLSDLMVDVWLLQRPASTFGELRTRMVRRVGRRRRRRRRLLLGRRWRHWRSVVVHQLAVRQTRHGAFRNIWKFYLNYFLQTRTIEMFFLFKCAITLRQLNIEKEQTWSTSGRGRMWTRVSVVSDQLTVAARRLQLDRAAGRTEMMSVDRVFVQRKRLEAVGTNRSHESAASVSVRAEVRVRIRVWGGVRVVADLLLIDWQKVVDLTRRFGGAGGRWSDSVSTRRNVLRRLRRQLLWQLRKLLTVVMMILTVVSQCDARAVKGSLKYKIDILKKMDRKESLLKMLTFKKSRFAKVVLH